MRLILAGKKGKWTIGFSFAWHGLAFMLKTERNFRIHLTVALLVVISSYFFQLTKVEWLFVIFSIGIVLVSEIFNTTVEKTIDYIQPDIHPAAKQIKDAAAGGVLVAAITAAIIGIIIFLPKIFS
ncbi:MAG TPA: diacylglycerol kinase family protein [Bacillota bacterium]|nr:diacylglycerol kinase family protein [Bacillota bacterium]